MPVQEGDTIFVSVADLDAKKDRAIDITWKQGFADVTEKYIQSTFTIVTAKDSAGKTGAETENAIFVQLSLLDNFKKKNVADKAEVTVIVDKEFMYGQKSKDGTNRWLVYHDKKHRPYQHRFVEATIMSAGEKAATIAKMLGFTSVDSVLKDLKGIFGDYLHPF